MLWFKGWWIFLLQIKSWWFSFQKALEKGVFGDIELTVETREDDNISSVLYIKCSDIGPSSVSLICCIYELAVVLEIDQNLWGRLRRKIVAFKLYYQKNKLQHVGFGLFLIFCFHLGGYKTIKPHLQVVEKLQLKRFAKAFNCWKSKTPAAY